MPSVSFKAGRDMKGAFAVGHGASASATMTETGAPDSSIDIGKTLQALRVQLAQIPGIEPKALKRLDEALEAVAKAEPEAGEITLLVDQATRYATKAAGFAGAIEQLTPHLKHVWHWAGVALPDWAAAIGLR